MSVRNQLLLLIAQEYGATVNDNMTRNELLNAILIAIGGSSETMVRNELLEKILENIST